MARKMLVDGGDGMEVEFDYDLFTIGAGSGGVRASRMSAGHGAKVAICELPFHPISSEKLGGCGGTCVIRGCVPKKILVYGSSFHGEFEDSKNFGWDMPGEITFDWKRLIENKTKEITRLNGVYKRILANAGVTLFEGAGKIIDPHTVEVHLTTGEIKRFTTKHILIATGSSAVLLDIPGFDDEMRGVVAKNLEGRGVNLHPSTNIIKIEKIEGGLKVYSDRGEEIETDVVLMAVGRKPNTTGLNLNAVGVELHKDGAIKVDEYSQTNIPSIWAVGDVTNRINLTPVALMEGTCLAKTLFGGEKIKPDYENVPCAVFSIPPLSVVGLSEQEAVSQTENDILVFTSSFTPMKNTISGRQEKTVMKLIVDAKTDKVLGAAMCGPDAPEIMQGIAVALKCNATKAQLDSTVGIHPSAAEEFVTMRTATRRVTPDGQVIKV
ncbi:hypothetical protein KP509_22G081700 [Ceratopteris richardii]|uniref:GRase n=1 Tax=Ceratopteris richardii TaxID=49495 RepID=A0A8T2SA43_CERRI|nr:hypothetical protein KP509_22G081700 [Ceratopteris richardii]